jgi:hypothetical protein
LAGLVQDSSGRAIPDTKVFLDDGAMQTVTDSSGVFRLSNVAVGLHAIHFRRDAYGPRSFTVELSPEDPSQDLGAIVLHSGPLPTAVLRGVVRESSGGQPVPGATVEVNGQPLAVTDAAGEFDVRPATVSWGENAVVIRHRSFVETVETGQFRILSYGDTVEFVVSLDVTPIPLPAVEVEAAASPVIPERLRGFYDRREKGIGTFWTREDIVQRDAPNMNVLFRGVRFRSMTTGRACEPVVIINGVPGELLDLTPELLAGVEIYRGIGSTPAEFSHLGSVCGVIVLWTH